MTVNVPIFYQNSGVNFDKILAHYPKSPSLSLKITFIFSKKFKMGHKIGKFFHEI